MHKLPLKLKEKLNRLVARVDGEKGEWTFDEKIWEVLAQELTRIDKERSFIYQVIELRDFYRLIKIDTKTARIVEERILGDTDIVDKY
jgi:hypothetical protein